VAEGYGYPETGKFTIGRRVREVTVDQKLNLGIVYKVPTIVQAIDHYLSTKGIEREQQDIAARATGPVDPP
jgi:hypothetical protein